MTIPAKLLPPYPLPSRHALAVGAGALLLMLLAALVLRRCSSTPRPAPPPPDTATAAAWRLRATEAERAYQVAAGEAGGLRGKLATAVARIRGLEARELPIVTVFDTIVRPDTVILSVGIDRGGHLVGSVGLRADSGGYRPGDTAPADVGACDDGWHLVGTHFVCDRARLGHLVVLARAGAAAPLERRFRAESVAGSAELALRWTPAYRSTLGLELATTSSGRLELRVEKGLRLW